jgi:hypothetical protein
MARDWAGSKVVLPPSMLRRRWVILCWMDFVVSRYWTWRLGHRATVARSLAIAVTLARAKVVLKAVVPTGQPRTRMPLEWIFSSGIMEGRK